MYICSLFCIKLYYSQSWWYSYMFTGKKLTKMSSSTVHTKSSEKHFDFANALKTIYSKIYFLSTTASQFHLHFRSDKETGEEATDILLKKVG